MGYMRHHAIVVTGWKDEHIKESVDEAKRLGLQVMGPGEPVTNGYRSFAIAPDGSKEGWEVSEDGDLKRDRFVEWMRDARRRELWLDWVEVQFGDDEGVSVVTRHSDQSYADDGPQEAA